MDFNKLTKKELSSLLQKVYNNSITTLNLLDNQEKTDISDHISWEHADIIEIIKRGTKK